MKETNDNLEKPNFLERKPESLTVLIVEDHADLRTALAAGIKRAGFQVREAANGLIAKTIFDLATNEIDLIISDINMPELNGIELLKHVRSVSSTPFIVMTGFSELLETHDAFELGAGDFLSKPFRAEAALTAIRNQFWPVPTAKVSEATKPPSLSYCAIHVNEFLTSSKLLSDIHVKLTDSKYIRVAHKGDQIPVDRLKTYRDRKVEYLYVTTDDFAAYVNFSLKLSTAALKSDIINNEKKLQLARQTTQVLVEQCFVAELDSAIYKPAQKMVEDTVALVSEDADISEVFLSFASSENRIYSHSVAVAVISCMIGKLNGWQSSSTLFKISLSGLLHDIGMKEIDPEVIKKRRLHRSPAETKQYESHALRGRDLLLELKNLPEDVALISLQHHERQNETGYPLRPAGSTLHPLAILIGVVDRFVELMMPFEEGAPVSNSVEAIRILWRQDPTQAEQNYIRGLADLFNVKADLEKVS